MVRIFLNKGALILLCVLAIPAVDANAQSGGPHLLQAAVDGLRNGHHAEQASTALREQQGVVMARFDPRTRNMMLHVDPELVLDGHAINALLEGTGITVRCLKRSVVGEAPFRHMDADNCTDLTPIAR